jgi:hypothetical protein
MFRLAKILQGFTNVQLDLIPVVTSDLDKTRPVKT